MKPSVKLMSIIAFLLSGVAVTAQPYTLDDCIRIALKANEQVKNSQLDVDASRYKVKEVKSALLPTVEINGSYTYYMNLPSQYAPASAFGGAAGEYKKLNLSMPQTLGANVVLTQALFNKALFTGLQAARVAHEASGLHVKLTQENLIYAVSSTYYTIQVLNDNLVRLTDNITNLEKTVVINGILKENEIVSENIHNRLLINLENLRNQQEHQKLLLSNNLTQLKYLMNINGETDSLVVAGYEDDLTDVDAVSNISNRPDIQLKQAELKLSVYDKSTAMARYYPVLNGSLSAGKTSFYDDLSPFKQVNDDWVGNSYFNVSLTIPVFDGFQRRNQVRQKEVAIQKNRNTLSMMRSNAEKELRDAQTNYSTNRNLLMNNKVSLVLAEKLFNTTQSEYTSGITSLTELLNAQNDLSNARTNYSDALLSLRLAELSLKKASGTLLQL